MKNQTSQTSKTEIKTYPGFNSNGKAIRITIPGADNQPTTKRTTETKNGITTYPGFDRNGKEIRITIPSR